LFGTARGSRAIGCPRAVFVVFVLDDGARGRRNRDSAKSTQAQRAERRSPPSHENLAHDRLRFPYSTGFCPRPYPPPWRAPAIGPLVQSRSLSEQVRRLLLQLSAKHSSYSTGGRIFAHERARRRTERGITALCEVRSWIESAPSKKARTSMRAQNSCGPAG
jgi:hypothetical protein